MQKLNKYICYVEGKQVHVWASDYVEARGKALDAYIGTKRAPKISVYLSVLAAA